MNDIPLIIWLELLRSYIGKTDTVMSLSIINELIDKLKKKNGLPENC